MDAQFISSLRERARLRHARIGIGIQSPSKALISGLHNATEYADLLLVGDPCCECALDYITPEDPASELVELLARGEIDGAVRGNVSASRAMKELSSRFNITVRRMALFELGEWAFFLAPVGIDEGETLADKLDLVLGGARYLKNMGISPAVSILSGGRMEDVGRSQRVDLTLADAEFVAARARDCGINAIHRGILIESCRGDDLILAPDGISGNLIFRTLMLLCGATSLGAPVLMDQVFVDSSRARNDFTGPVMLASALVGMKESFR
jgi:putative methanogen marker protein 4